MAVVRALMRAVSGANPLASVEHPVSAIPGTVHGPLGFPRKAFRGSCTNWSARVHQFLSAADGLGVEGCRAGIHGMRVVYHLGAAPLEGRHAAIGITPSA